MTDEQQNGDEVEGVGRHAARAAGEQIRDLAEREAAAAETDEPDEPDQPQPEPEPDTEPTAVQLAHAAYIRALAEEMGPDAEIVPCSSCGGMGFNPITFPPDQNRQQCPDCQGWGIVETGSRVQGQERLSCLTCNGNGWLNATPGGERSGLHPTVQPPVLPVFVPPPPPPPAEPATVAGEAAR